MKSVAESGFAAVLLRFSFPLASNVLMAESELFSRTWELSHRKPPESLYYDQASHQLSKPQDIFCCLQTSCQLFVLLRRSLGSAVPQWLSVLQNIFLLSFPSLNLQKTHCTTIGEGLECLAAQAFSWVLPCNWRRLFNLEKLSLRLRQPHIWQATQRSNIGKSWLLKADRSVSGLFTFSHIRPLQTHPLNVL